MTEDQENKRVDENQQQGEAGELARSDSSQADCDPEAIQACHDDEAQGDAQPCCATGNQDCGGCASQSVMSIQSAPAGRQRRAMGKKPDKYRKHLLCRYGKMGYLALFAHDIEDFPDKASHAIVNTERGQEIAEIVGHDTLHRKGSCQIKESQINTYMKDSCDNFPLDRNGTVVRVATEQDVREQKHLNHGISKELAYCEELKTKLGLDMILVDAERLFGGERIIFYFMAEGRIDFRQLVKDLAQQYQTRIEMRQVGARDEARLVADFETCGRQCCCKSFLKVLYPVNMRMAKLQKATLDPTKISGRCGRLKCCLRFEDEVYQEHKKKLPRKGSIVLTPEGHGTVIDTQVLTLLVKVHLSDGKMIALKMDEILEFNYTPPAEPEPGEKPTENDRGRRGEGRGRDRDRDRDRDKDRNRRPEPVKARPQEEISGSDEDEDEEDDLIVMEGQGESAGYKAEGTDTEGDGKKKKRRRRRRKKKRNGDGSENQADGSSAVDDE